MTDFSRRQFLTKSGASALTVSLGASVAKAADLKTKTLKVGIVGLGRRGAGAVQNILDADPQVILWAVGDITEETTAKRVAELKAKYGERIQCEGRVFNGYDSFEKVADAGIDIIMLTTSPAFRPAQIKRSFGKGLHVFAEKPWCVDSPGLSMVQEAVEEGNKKGLSFLTGLVWRYTSAAQKIYETALSGELGDIQTAHGYYCLWQSATRKKNLDPKKFTNIHAHNGNMSWFAFRELSGDWMLEQFIHTVDKLSWAMNDQLPERCFGVGSRPFDYPIRNTTKSINMT